MSLDVFGAVRLKSARRVAQMSIQQNIYGLSPGQVIIAPEDNFTTTVFYSSWIAEGGLYAQK
jgi:hypothetical protein